MHRNGYLYFALMLFICCKQNNNVTYQHLTGKAMGSTYSIKYKGEVDHQKSIDSLLAEFNASLSTYDTTSTISRFNRSQRGICFAKLQDRFFQYSLEQAISISKLSGGSLDPTIAPLVDYYGFGYNNKTKPLNTTDEQIDSLKLLIGVDKIGIDVGKDSICVYKKNKDVRLDLNASAPGHGVDEVANFLKSKNIFDFMIEIGGEVSASGVNTKNENWSIGINKPVVGSAENTVVLPVSLKNKALATSGNYRNFFDNGSVKLAHIIDPVSGNAKPSDILSATIIADNCLTADALATVCMVKGLKEAIQFVESLDKIDAFFIYKDVNKDSLLFYESPNFKTYLRN